MQETPNAGLCISGPYERLARAVRFAILYMDGREVMAQFREPIKPGFKIENGVYIFGHKTENNSLEKLPFGYDHEIVAAIIEQWLKKQSKQEQFIMYTRATLPRKFKASIPNYKDGILFVMPPEKANTQEETDS